MKLAIIYHSESGNTKKVAEMIAQGAEKAGNVETRTMSIDAVDEEFLAEAKAVMFGTPTYFATYSWQMKKWLDLTRPKVAGKLGGVFATANFFGGGAEIAEQGLLMHLLALGMLAYSVGTACGLPFTHLGTVAIKTGSEFEQDRAKIYGERFAAKALELFGE